jgi:carbohydrate-selective porin OprB
MRKIAAVSCAVSMGSASSVFATDLTTTAQFQEQISRDSPNLQTFPGTGPQSFVFGDWSGLRSSLSNQGIDLGLSYLSEPAWNVAGGRGLEGT